MTLFWVIFFSGLLPSILILLFAHSLMPWLLSIGIAHIVGLFVVAFRLSSRALPLAIDTLHKAGFLHTLLALGAAVIISGNLIRGGNFDSASLSQVLLPMGAALIPHILGLMGGQGLQMRSVAPEQEETKQLRELRDLHKKRKEVLEQIIGITAVERDLQSDICDKLRAQKLTVEQTSTVLLSFQTALQTLLTDTRNALAAVKTATTELTAELTATRNEAEKVRTEMETIAADVKKLTLLFKDTELLHRKILEFLESDLFKKAA